jgi:hypothetical protein
VLESWLHAAWVGDESDGACVVCHTLLRFESRFRQTCTSVALGQHQPSVHQKWQSKRTSVDSGCAGGCTAVGGRACHHREQHRGRGCWKTRCRTGHVPSRRCHGERGRECGSARRVCGARDKSRRAVDLDARNGQCEGRCGGVFSRLSTRPCTLPRSPPPRSERVGCPTDDDVVVRVGRQRRERLRSASSRCRRCRNNGSVTAHWE